MLYRLPIPLYRARLGFVFGERFLMLEHTGRKSGQIRRTILEVVANHPDAVYVAAGWGAAAEWLKNVKANPEVVVYLGFKRFRTSARMVTEGEARTVMSEYAERHSRSLDRLAAFMLTDPGKSAEQQAERIAANVPMVRLPKG